MRNPRTLFSRLRGLISLPSVLFGAALTLALIVGRSIFFTNGFWFAFGSGSAFARSAGRALLYFAVISTAASLLMRWLSDDKYGLRDAVEPPTRLGTRVFLGETCRTFWFLWAVILICWVPCLLAYWPGIFSYDITTSLIQGDGHGYNQMQPLLYTLFVKAVYGMTSSGGVEASILGMSIAQMLGMSALFASIVWRLNRMRVHATLRGLSLVWFALYPSIPIFALAETKDTIFAGVFALVTLDMIKLSRDPAEFFAKVRRPIVLGVLLLLLGLLRNNGILVLVLLVLVVVLQHKSWLPVFKKLLAVVSGAVIATITVTQLLYPALGVAGMMSRLMISVPVQQIAFVYAVDKQGMTQKDQDAVNYWILQNIDHNFNPRLADLLVLYTRDVGFNRPSAGFLAAWVRVGLSHPAAYSQAFLSATLQSWYPGSAFPDQYARRDYIETYIGSQSGVIRESKAPAVLGFYQSIAVKASWQHIPVISLLFDTAVPLWFLLFGVALAAARKRRRDMIVYLMPLALIATIMLGPVINGRYMLPFFVSYPLWLIPMLSRRPDVVTEAVRFRQDDS